MDEWLAGLGGNKLISAKSSNSLTDIGLGNKIYISTKQIKKEDTHTSAGISVNWSKKSTVGS